MRAFYVILVITPGVTPFIDLAIGGYEVIIPDIGPTSYLCMVYVNIADDISVIGIGVGGSRMVDNYIKYLLIDPDVIRCRQTGSPDRLVHHIGF